MDSKNPSAGKGAGVSVNWQADKLTPHRIITACRKAEVSPSRFGRNAIGDPRLVSDLRRGREMRPDTRVRVALYLMKLETQA